MSPKLRMGLFAVVILAALVVGLGLAGLLALALSSASPPTTKAGAKTSRPSPQPPKQTAPAPGKADSLDPDETAAVAAGGVIVVVIVLACVLSGLLSLVVYVIPTVVALVRKHPSLGAIIVVNVFLGWSLVGWVVAFAWAMTAIDTEKSYR